MMIIYDIILYPLSQNYVVQLQFIPTSDKQILHLPTWIPGSYMVREFSKNIIAVSATQDTSIVSCNQIDKCTWELISLIPHKIVICEYTVHAYEVGIRSAFLDSSRGYFNPTSLCMYVQGLEHLPHTINIRKLPANWEVATNLTNVGKNKYHAVNYATLIDFPIELGHITRLEFTHAKVKYAIAISGTLHHNFDPQRLIADVMLLCKTQRTLFGNKTPFTNYLFILYLGGEVYTGLEHGSSTLLMAPYYSIPLKNISFDNSEYLKLLRLMSHELFHAWNIKAIKPQQFNPYNLINENYTQLLWWFEGITSYYDALILYRAQIITQTQYLELLVQKINDLFKYAGHQNQTLANSSLTAWIKYYKPDANSPNVNVSYYIKGALVGLCLDLLIRSKSQHSLDTVMLRLYQKWCDDGLGIIENQLPQLIHQITGCDLSQQLYDFVHTTRELPLMKLLAKFGIQLHIVQHQAYDSHGKVVVSKSALPSIIHYDFGCKLVQQAPGYLVQYVYVNTPAADSGIVSNDVIIAIDDIKLTNLSLQLALYKEYDIINLSVFRQDRLLNIPIRLLRSTCSVRYLRVTNQSKLNLWL